MPPPEKKHRSRRASQSSKRPDSSAPSTSRSGKSSSPIRKFLFEKHGANVPFGFVIALFVIAVITFIANRELGVVLGIVHMAMTMVVFRINDGRGFNHRNEMRRATDPPHHFGQFQMLSLILLLLASMVASVIWIVQQYA